MKCLYYILFACFLSVSGHANIRPNYIDCQDSSECTGETCCVLGSGRFSLPTCKNYQEMDEICNTNNNAYNTTVSYPDGVVVGFTNVYLLHCQCAAGLECNVQTSRCYDPSAEPDFNFLHI